jgi:hypothetical protein
VLRKFGRYEVFKMNLDTLAHVFRQYPQAPKMRFITMAFRSNFDEIPAIVEYSHQHWLSSENEIRYTYNVAHITDEFRKQHYLHKEQWGELTDRLRQVPYRWTISYPPADGPDELIQPSANYPRLDGGDLPRAAAFLRTCARPLSFRARPDGTLLVVGRENEFAINLLSLDNPSAFLRASLSA